VSADDSAGTGMKHLSLGLCCGSGSSGAVGERGLLAQIIRLFAQALFQSCPALASPVQSVIPVCAVQEAESGRFLRAWVAMAGGWDGGCNGNVEMSRLDAEWK